ncbi:hypothetical protein [Demequina sediminicola]|uniref:hypothetical protein n=1 Tax=Demequina sediminicola TaxID=1095026 RepID=UPI0007859F13|nr:hypothetical protein [Demequina sediminicola]
MLAGILLIAVSVVGVGLVVRSADVTVDYYMADETLPPGTVLTEDNVRVSSAKVDGDMYWEATGADSDDAVPYGAVVTRTITAGELLPVSATADADKIGLRPLPVAASLPVSEDIGVGSVVDIWMTVAVPADGGIESATVIVAEQVAVTAIERSESNFGGGHGATVHVAIDHAEVPAFLQAISREGELVVVGWGGA